MPSFSSCIIYNFFVGIQCTTLYRTRVKDTNVDEKHTNILLKCESRTYAGIIGPEEYKWLARNTLYIMIGESTSQSANKPKVADLNVFKATTELGQFAEVSC